MTLLKSRMLVLAVIAGAALAPAAQARSAAPVLTGIRCVPATAKSCQGGVAVTVGKPLQLRGRHLVSGMRVAFRWTTGALGSKLHHTKTGWVVVVPGGTRAGTVGVTVSDRSGRRSNRRSFRVLASAPVTIPATSPKGLPGVFSGPGMWIWQLPKTEGGDLQKIIARARTAGMQTVFVKAADGATRWSQFSPQLVATLHAGGLRVCAWQFVYGTHPTDEATAAASAVTAGADCFVIDAEGQYEGRYKSAQLYMTALRKAVGPVYPIGLTSFPYVDFHPGLPYSVFLAPGNAQANLPQDYWKDIGSTVDRVSAHTLMHNRIYQAPIAPLGQTYQHPAGAEIQRFRQVWAAYGAGGESWWDWQETQADTWATLTGPPPAPVTLADPGWPALKQGSKGDEVIWLQQHLASSDPSVKITAKYDAALVAAVQRFQVAHAIPATGSMDPATWQDVLALPLRAVDWTAG